MTVVERTLQQRHGSTMLSPPGTVERSVPIDTAFPEQVHLLGSSKYEAREEGSYVCNSTASARSL